jgi:2-aminoadipate transaminase
VIAYDFATGNTNPESFPAEAFAEAAAQVISTMAIQLSRYHGKFGHEGLRRLMAEREYEREGVRLDPDRIILTNGSMQAITLAAQALCHGRDDLIVMEEYCYPGSINAFRSMGIEMVGIPVDEQGMQTTVLAEVLDRLAGQDRLPRFIYTLTTYQNPTGAVMPRERRLQLIDLARRHDCVVIEDNCYGDVHFEGEKEPALYALDDDPRHIYLCSLSKIFAPGVRLGYLTASPEMLERILAKRHDAGPNTLAAAITAEYLQGRLWQHIEMANAALKKKRDAMLRALHSHSGNLYSFSHPVGGLFIWLRLADDIDQDLLTQIAAEKGVTFLPGSSFHIDGKAGPYLRLAFGFPTVAEIETGIARLAESMHAAREATAK